MRRPSLLHEGMRRFRDHCSLMKAEGSRHSDEKLEEVHMSIKDRLLRLERKVFPEHTPYDSGVAFVHHAHLNSAACEVLGREMTEEEAVQWFRWRENTPDRGSGGLLEQIRRGIR
jgi:hypothetical protein